MNKIFVSKNEPISVLEWRKQNVEYLIDEYIPFLINKLKTPKTDVKDIKLEELTGQYSTEGFSYKNLKLLSFVLITNRGEFDIKVKLPVPSHDDIFTINRKHYILVNVLHDHIYYILNKTIYSVTFRITHEGLWYQFKGSQSKTQVGIPLVNLFYTLNILDTWFKNYEISSESIEGKECIQIGDSKEWFCYDKDEQREKDFYHGYELLKKSFQYIKKWDHVVKNSDKLMDKINAHNPFEYSLEYEFLLGYNDLGKLYNEMLERYQEKYLQLVDEIHIDFKRVGYYSTLLTPFEKRIQTLLGLFKRAKNADIAWHQKMPNNLLTKDAKTNKYLQYLELKNPFEEIAIKTKLVTPLDNVPKYMRKTMNSAYGQICPLDTPDSKNIGVVQHLAVTANLDKNGFFISK